MSKGNPLERLKQGLAVFREGIRARKDTLLERLKNKEQISSADERWLDGDANDVDETRILDALERASDYERGLSRLSEQDRSLVDKLKALVAEPVKKIAAKRKRPEVRAAPQKKGPPAPKFTRKENATLEQRIKILDWYHANGRNQTATADHFDKLYPNLKLKQPLISDWVKNEQKWRRKWDEAEASAAANARAAKRQRQTEHPEVTEMLELWVTKAMSDGLLVTGEVLRQKWTRFADLCNVPQDERLKLSEGWLDAFKARVGLKGIRRHGEAASADAQVVIQDRERLRELIRKHGYRLKDIFNMDETGLFWALAPDRGLATKQMSGIKGNKVRLTYAFTMNADGSEKLPPFIIGKANKPRCFRNRSGAALGFYYRNNAKAWMTSALYREWIIDWDCKLRHDGRKILLLVDNFSGHCDVPELTNITVVNFAPNITAHVQPADAGIIRCFKAHYRRMFIERAIDRYDSDVAPLDIYKLDQLEAMRLAADAWKEVDRTTIRNCWRKTGILPESLTAPAPAPGMPSVPIGALLNPVEDAERAVERTLDELENCGALHKRNRMAVAELLNPQDEHVLVEETSDAEIFDAVKERHAAVEDMSITGGDDGQDEPDIAEAVPSRKDALAAALLLQRYVDGKEDGWARQLEESLRRFGRNTRLEATRLLKPTEITQFFAPKSS